MARSARVPRDGITITKATVEDVPIVKSMIDSAYSKYIERIGKPPAPMAANYYEIIKTHGIFLLKSPEHHTVGSIVLKYVSNTRSVQIDNIVVDPSAQGHGYGRVLMDYAENVARSHGCPALELYTNVKMYENLELYPKMGFVETESKTEDGFERVYFRKDLT